MALETFSFSNLLLYFGIVLKDFLYSSYDSPLKHDLDAMGMRWGVRQYLHDNAFCKRTSSLVLFLYDPDLDPGLDGISIVSLHNLPPFQ